MNINFNPYYQSSLGLIIGINNYQNVQPLSYACNDADAIADILTSELDFPPDKVILLKDDQATKQSIMDNYLRFTVSCDPDSRILVFFAGHGHTYEGLRGPVGYLVPVDGNLNNLNSLIRWDDLIRNAELIPAKHILYIMDACYSGLALQRAIPPGGQRFLSDMLQRLSRQVISAGKADETVADGGGLQGKNSLFTGYLIEGLRGAATDSNGILTANEIMTYVYKKVGQDNRSKQTPHYGYVDGDGDFIFRTPNREHINPVIHNNLRIRTSYEMPVIPPENANTIIKTSYINKNGYSDPTNPNFGRNDWTKKLGEFRRNGEQLDEARAYSWLSMISEPTNQLPSLIDIKELSTTLTKFKSTGRSFEQFKLPQNVMTTIDSVLLFDEWDRNRSLWKKYFKVDKNGNIEYADSHHVFMELKGVRVFNYVQIIGSIWQFLFIAKNILHNSGYDYEFNLSVNLVGTKETILGDFSQENGENNRFWISPFSSKGAGPFEQENLFGLKCADSNLQLVFRIDPKTLDETSSFEIIKEVANSLGLAYNHQSPPRCFNYNTEIFPWKQYDERRNAW